MEKGCPLLFGYSLWERHFRHELPTAHKLKYAAQFCVAHSRGFLHAEVKLRR